jgi:DNA-binding PucR family transcriptional regulator
MSEPDPTRALIGRICTALLNELDAYTDVVATAITSADPALAADPTLADEVVASSRANAEGFLRALADDPSAPVPAGVPPAALDLARTLVRRGIELDALAHAYRRGQNAAWRAWLDAAQQLAAPEQLPELLALSSELLFGYVDGVLGAMAEQMEEERAALLQGASARRQQTVRLLLEGAPIDEETAARRLGYALDRHHTAFIAWTDGEARPGALERLAEGLARAAGATRALSVPATTRALWGWIGSAGPVDVAPLRAAAELAPPGVRVALGTTRPGAAGFRAAHEQALAVQRMLAGRPSPDRLVAYREIEVLTLLGDDRPRLRAFVAETLGPLGVSDASAARLRETLRVYLQEGDNAARAAARLGTHRNTVLHRVARAEELLGEPLRERRLALAVALEAEARLGVLRGER